jgi:hypothetical protein
MNLGGICKLEFGKINGKKVSVKKSIPEPRAQRLLD